MKFEAKNKQEEMILAYLNENMSDKLKSKVENGYTVEKDGTTYLCKKDMTSLMQYIYEQAKKQAQNNCAMIEDKIVYGWAMHYLEEDSIEGKLYTLDGKEYKPTQKTEPTKPVTPKQNTSTTPAPTPKKKQSGRMQMSIFDMAETPKQETILKEENNNSPSEEIPVSEYKPEQNDDEYEDEDEDIEEDIYEHFDPEAVAILEQTLENITLK